MQALPFEWVIATRFLREGRFQSLLIIGGAAIGVAVVIFITALVNGLQANTIKRVLGTQAHIVIRPTEEVARPQREADAGLLPRIEARAQRLRSIDQWQPLVATLDTMPELDGVSPMVSGPGFAVRGNATKAIAVFGVDPPRYDRIVSLTERLVQGTFRVQANEAVIGRELAQDLGLAVGDRFRLVTSEGGVAVAETFTVTGIVDLGVRDLNRRSVYIGFRTAQALLSLPGGASQIDLKVVSLFDAEQVAKALQAQTGLTVESWMRTNEQLLAALRAQTITTTTIRIFVSAIVVLGIASVLVVSVVQKRREIGILRAMGTTRQQMLGVFLVQGALFGLAGSLLGGAAGYGLVGAFNAFGPKLFYIPVNPWLLAAASLLATVTGIVSAAIPARRAAGLDPVEAIRHV